MEPIAKGVAGRGHDVHVVAPWHPAIRRGPVEDGVSFHFYRYAPIASLNVFGYAGGLKADTNVRASAWLAAPLALLAGWSTARQVARRYGATIVHGHWVVPGGITAALAAGGRPLVISLHGSDVYVAERHVMMRRAARTAFGRARWVTACSDDLRRRAVALGADPARIETVPYGVDTARFAPRPHERATRRQALGVTDGPLVFTAGRLVRKKGFEYLIDAVLHLAGRWPSIRLAIAGEGDLRDELEARAHRMAPVVTFLGARSQDDVGRLAAAADVVAVPSVHDLEGNVDGLPNFALEAMATTTPVVATRVGGLADAIADGVTGRLVPERDAAALAGAIAGLLENDDVRQRLGQAARRAVIDRFGWHRVIDRLEFAYDRVAHGREPGPARH
jgi:glycosyltransferase involved in cell wall biosynthesis